MKKLILILVFSLSAWAGSVYSLTVDKPMDKAYPELLEAFEKAHLVVAAEINILEKFKAVGLPEKFGKNFNTNELTGIRAIIACNGWFGNEVANADPMMMAFCPVRITLVEKDGKTSVLFVKPTVAPQDTKAYAILEKLESKVISVISSTWKRSE